MSRIANLTFACEDPDRLADFWAAALGYEKEPAPPGILEALQREGKDPNIAAAVSDPARRGPRLYFERKRKSPTETVPLHLDLQADDAEAEAARLVALGATLVERRTQTIGPFTSTWIYMRDPEGNGFCLQ